MSRSLRITAWIVAAAVAGLQAWAYRYSMNPDGLSYLDIARAFLVGDLDTALNPHWGPLYPALLALGFGLLRPSTAWVIPVTHLVTFAVFLVALAAFDFFLRELVRGREVVRAQKVPLGEAPPGEQEPPARDKGDAGTSALALFGYAVFIYAALELTALQLVTPDLCVMASVFAAAGFVLRMQRRGPARWDAVLLGVVLALGYFAKSVMFPIGLAFIAGLVLLPGVRGREKGGAVALAGVVFLALCALLIVPFSRETGGLTFGTAGKLAYNWEVNKVPYTNWQGDAAGVSRLEHPPRQVQSAPDVFEYSAHLRGTFPPWFDPAYWNAGVSVPIHPWRQVLQFHRSAQFYVDVFLGSAGAIATLWVALIWLGMGGRPEPGGLRRYWPVLLPSLAALALYFPVHLEERYIAPFAALLWVVPVAAAGARAPLAWPSWFGRAALTVAALLVTPVAFRALSEVGEQRDATNPYPVVAARLHALGLRPGDRVANVAVQRGENFGSSFAAYWAYLAGVQIVAEIPEHRDFLCADPSVTAKTLDGLAAVGARAVITRAIPARACEKGWERIEGTDFYVRLLPHPK